MPVLFSATLFLSAALLFFIELMFGSMILPKFGGTPAVWNTCMLFFQAAMLGGYSYAHWATDRFGVRKHLPIHLLLMLAPLIFMPIAVKFEPPGEGNPVLWLLIILAVSVGVPFFMISTTNPLLTMWFTETGHPSARDPYFLYAASNIGSMLALLAYPFVPMIHLGLQAQALIWAGLFVALLVLMACCGYVVRKAPPLQALPDAVVGTSGEEQSLDAPTGSGAGGGPRDEASDRKRSQSAGAADLDDTPPSRRRIAWWVGLAFVPSSLMLGVTTYLSTDYPSGPLIWVPPLALYLLSFILVFSRLPRIVHTLMILSLPVLILLQTYLMLSESGHSKIVIIVLHLSTLFVVAMVCHGELAHNRPHPKYLTAFYLWMSFGGVLGGLFNALVAPVVFKTVVEYPLVMALACVFMPNLDMDRTGTPGRWREFAVPLVLGLIFAAFIFQGHADVALARRDHQRAEKRLQAAIEDSEISPQVRAHRAEIEANTRHSLYTRFLLGIPLALLIVAGGYSFRTLAQTAERPNFGRFFLTWLGVGVVAGCLIHLPAEVIDARMNNVTEQVANGELDKEAAEKMLTDMSEELQPVAVLRWWFGLPLALAFLCLLLPRPSEEQEERGWAPALDIAAAVTFAVIVGIFLLYLGDYTRARDKVVWMSNELQALFNGMANYSPVFEGIARKLRAQRWWEIRTMIQFGVPVLLCYAWVTRPIRFGLGVGAILLATGLYNVHRNEDVLMRERSFFGTLKLEREDTEVGKKTIYYHRLVHGTTLHGMQEVEEGEDHKFHPVHDAEPLTYYHRTGPLGQIFAMLEENKDEPARPLALIGLGTGTTSRYGRPGQEVVFYEIDAKVKAIAENEEYFSYLSDARARGANLDFVMGDARLSMAKDPDKDRQGRRDGHFRLIVVDAFSSDAIPVHLITYQALELYLQKMAPDGIVAFHISNRYLDLQPVLATLAQKANLACLVRHDYKDEEKYPGKAASTWVILARDEHKDKAFGSIMKDIKATSHGEETFQKMDKLRQRLKSASPTRFDELVKDIRKVRSERDEAPEKWYWIHERKNWSWYWDAEKQQVAEDYIPDTPLWTDDYQNILAIFNW